jgi:hypothetical protein
MFEVLRKVSLKPDQTRVEKSRGITVERGISSAPIDCYERVVKQAESTQASLICLSNWRNSCRNLKISARQSIGVDNKRKQDF